MAPTPSPHGPRVHPSGQHPSGQHPSGPHTEPAAGARPNRQQRRRRARERVRDARREAPRGSRRASAPAQVPETVLRPRSAADVACVVPVLLGFHPEESLVALCLHGERRRIGMSARVDLPPPEVLPDEVALGAWAAPRPDRTDTADTAAAAVALRARVVEVVGHVARQDVVGVLLVAYTRRQPVAMLALDAAAEALEAAGVPVAQAAWTDGERVHGYGCDDDTCCPPGGTPYDPAGNRWVAAAVADGQEILPDRRALVDRFRAQPAGVALVAATGTVEHELGTLRAGLLRPDHDPTLVRAGRDATRAAAARPSPLSDRDVAVLSVWTGSIVVRDLLWCDITRDRARECLALWREVGRRATPGHRAPALALAGFAAWMCGDGAQAVTALELALGADPDHSMSELLLTAVTGGVDPAHWGVLSPQEVLRGVPGLDAADRRDLGRSAPPA